MCVCVCIMPEFQRLYELNRGPEVCVMRQLYYMQGYDSDCTCAPTLARKLRVVHCLGG